MIFSLTIKQTGRVGRKPLGYKALVKLCYRVLRNSQVLPLCEADDVLGILATIRYF